MGRRQKKAKGTFERRVSKKIKVCTNINEENLSPPKIVKTKKGTGNGILKGYQEMIDSEGEKYIPFCKYRWHRGIIMSGAESCVRKTCNHYGTLYEKNCSKDELEKQKHSLEEIV